MPRLNVLSLFALLVGGASLAAAEVDLSTWQPQPVDATKTQVTGGVASIEHEKWGYLVSPADHADVEISAVVTIGAETKRKQFFGQSWSVWPDATLPDGGFEAGLLLRGIEGDGKTRKSVGYRVQLSHALQQVVLVRFPEGGYLRAVACPVKLNEPQRLQVSMQGNELRVAVDGQERIVYRDPIAPLPPGRVGLGAANGVAVKFEQVQLRELPPATGTAQPTPHEPNFAARTWLGGRTWIFDGDEPILQMPSLKSTPVLNVKLRPGYKPQLTWNSHWDIQNQGAYAEGKNDTVDVQVSGGGKTIVARWRGEHVQKRFETHTTLTVGYDAAKNRYAYDVDSTLEVLPGEPFLFKYGYDFEHHTPIDPFNWQYLIVRRRDGSYYHRPVYPIDPGPQYDLATAGGVRVWYGRHNVPAPIVPAVEYIEFDAGDRKLNTAVCAAFYDTAVAFERENALPGTKLRVHYRYTGYPADEAEKLFRQTQVYESPMLDPQHHYVFAEWPKQTFSQFVPLSETWIFGRAPFKTGHNRRPTYELARNEQTSSGFALKLGPLAFGEAALPMPGPLPAGRYAVVAQCRADNVQGSGGRIDVTALGEKGDPLVESHHFIGRGNFGWKTVGFVFETKAEAKTLKLGLANAGSGDVYFSDVEVVHLDAASTLPLGVATEPQPAPTSIAPPPGAIIDFRLTEQKGYVALNYGSANPPLLETANASWTVDEGRPALRFGANPEGKRNYLRDGKLALEVFTNSSNKAGETASFALAGTHGGGREFTGVTISTWAKPAETMEPSHWGSDIVGFGARRFKLCLQGKSPPYRLGATFNNSDALWSDAQLDAGRWYHVALSGEPTADKTWRVRIYVDGKQAAEGVTAKLPVPLQAPLSLVLGTELFYLNGAYYHGLVGRTLVFDRTLTAEEIAALARE